MPKWIFQKTSTDQQGVFIFLEFRFPTPLLRRLRETNLQCSDIVLTAQCFHALAAVWVRTRCQLEGTARISDQSEI
jgi:hypothetical protein